MFLGLLATDLVRGAIAQFVIDGNPLAGGQRRQAKLGRMRFVVALFGFFTYGQKIIERNLIAAFRDLELTQPEEFVIRLMELLPDGWFSINEPGINLREMEAQRLRGSHVLLLEREGRSRRWPGRS